MLASAGELRIALRGGAGLGGRLEEIRTELERLLQAMCPDRRAATPQDKDGAAAEMRSTLENVLEQVRCAESDFRRTHGREELLLETLEADIRRARLLPLVMLTDSLRRAVRDLAQSLGKMIRYEVDVGQILLDKAVIEALREPLLHLVRNACDHGIETPEERRAAGKSPEGTLRIQAACRGERIHLTIADDGRGICFERVRERLRRSGACQVDVQTLSERELVKYLFEPGFTTVEAGHVSGRGVGLDVVLQTILRLQGSVELESSSPAGTAFVLTVPVTVSTVRILTVFSHGQFFGVPTSSVVSTGRARPEDLREWQGRMVLPLDGRPVPWVTLAEILHVPGSQPLANHRQWPYLLVALEGRHVAVAVDDLEEESEVLLKPVGFPLNSLAGVVGGTIRPDGSVQVVLDVGKLVLGHAELRPPPASPHRAVPRILVVDDSPTARAILRNVFAAAGYAVRTATDGVDALERLRSGPADVVVSDVEMPRLNGFDLTR